MKTDSDKAQVDAGLLAAIGRLRKYGQLRDVDGSDDAEAIELICLAALRAPPPEAGVRTISDAQLSEGIKWIDWDGALSTHDEMRQLRCAVEKMFCLQLPTDCPPNLTEEICNIVDTCRGAHVIGAETAKAIYKAVAKYAEPGSARATTRFGYAAFQQCAR